VLFPRLQDRIRELRSEIAAIRENQPEPEPFLRLALSELKSALEEHIGQLRKLAAKLSKALKGTPPRNIWLVPFRRLVDRIRELGSKLGALRENQLEPFLRSVLSELKSALRQNTERLRKLAAAKRSKTVRGRPRKRHYRRSIYADGKGFWSSTWTRATPPMVLKCSICNRPLPAEGGRADEDGKMVHGVCYIQRLVEAQGDPFIMLKMLKCSICDRPLQAEDGRADEDGQLVHGGCYIQRLVEAQGDPFNPRHVE
jgi:DNA repair exonuclease SbcCD ATPase subunit